ncbi:hypothetical protein [Actinomadura napierensis]|uniref:Transposase n=1 Tax=Actinomadura napierensis TaxID=267854 RepID=A0ABP5JSP3_9ACTN
MVSADHEGAANPIGITETWKRFSRSFFSLLWERQSFRKRWALRWRTETAVREIAEGLSRQVAAGIPKLIGVWDLSVTVRQALVYEFPSTGSSGTNPPPPAAPSSKPSAKPKRTSRSPAPSPKSPSPPPCPWTAPSTKPPRSLPRTRLHPRRQPDLTRHHTTINLVR